MKKGRSSKFLTVTSPFEVIDMRMKFPLAFCCFLLMLVSGISAGYVSAMPQSYCVSGRVVDKLGLGERMRVVLGPDDTRPWTGIDFLVESHTPGADGSFRLAADGEAGQRRTLYAIAGDFSGMMFIEPPFLYASGVDERYRGVPITLETSREIEVGDIHVQAWYEAATVKVTRQGRNLTREDWERLYCGTFDETGKEIGGQTIGPVLPENEVDIASSTLRLSLPNGKWKLVFQIFDPSTGSIQQAPVGSSNLFIIERGSKPKLAVDISM